MIASAEVEKAAHQDRDAFRQLIKKLKKADKRLLDETVHSLHHAIFNDYDCLTCANCCRNLGPRFTNHDISRLAASMKIKETVFIF